MRLRQLNPGMLSLEEVSGAWLPHVRRLPSRTWDKERARWLVPHTKENWAYLTEHKFPTDGVTPATRSGYQLSRPTGSPYLLLQVPKGSKRDLETCRHIPDGKSFSMKHEGWLVKPTVANLQYLVDQFPTADWDPGTEAIRRTLLVQTEQAQAAATGDLRPEDVTDYRFHTRPFNHQLEVFLKSRTKKVFGIFMEQGTGKSKVIVDTAGYLYQRGYITGVLVISPKSVKTVWEDEVQLHLGPEIPREVHVYSPYYPERATRWALTTSPPGDKEPLKWLIMNVDGFSTSKAPGVAKKFLQKRRCLGVVDESQRIKTPSAQRTRAIIHLARHIPVRRILSATPLKQSPFDLYSQFQYLDPTILGFTSFGGFKNYHGIFGGWMNKQVLGYNHLEELAKAIQDYGYRKLKEDCLDLPPKLYNKIVVDLAPEQRRLYNELKDQMLATYGESYIEVTTVISQFMRLQQIVGGHIPLANPDGTYTNDTPIRGPNPKLEALADLLVGLEGKAVIWAFFRAELELIRKTLAKTYGADSVVIYHGGISERDRATNRRAFQDPANHVRWFIGQTQTGGLGLTLTAASTAIYYGNTFDFEARVHSEDRIHRIGQTKSCMIYDIIAKSTVDYRLLQVLRNKKSLSDQLTGDKWKEWL